MWTLCVHADEDIEATLTALEAPPASFEECIKMGFFIWRALTAEERQAGTSRSSHLLHLPGVCLDLAVLPLQACV